MTMNYFKSRAVWAVFIFLVGGAAGAYAMTVISHHATPIFSKETRAKMSGTKFTNPLLECKELPESLSIGQRLELQTKVEERIALAKKVGFLTNGAVYFRDLNNGPWFGVNEGLKFYPASLLKVPLAVSLFAKAEDNPEILKTEVEFAGSNENIEASQAFGSSMRLETGKTYTASQLIKVMLHESSNEAALLLVQILGADNVLTVYKDFGISSPNLGEDYQIDVHTYASFFRILFNATYIDRSASEEMLGIMTKSAFEEGLVAGVPKEITVSHKFGTREIADGAIKQLHDCGIVYAQSTPYILCIMTQGTDYRKLAEFIQDISRIVYTNIETNHD